MKNQPTAEMKEQVKNIPLYQQSIAQNFFPILEKPEIARGFPDNWMTPMLAQALETGAAEFVLSTGTHHARMQIIRPPYFLLHSYYQLWSEHPDIGFTWWRHCQRASLTTVLATEHVARINSRKSGSQALGMTSLDARRLDERTLYLNQKLDPAHWSRADIEQMLDDLETVWQAHPDGLYHLDCSSYHLVHFLRKVEQFGQTHRFRQPASVVHAYEYTPGNVRRFLIGQLDCPVVDLFGSTELGYLYYSDRQGRYTPYLDKMRLELQPIATGSRIYSLIVSSVRNPYMPLIRYRSGDCVQTVDNSDDPKSIVRFCGREKEMLNTSQGIFSQADVDDLIGTASPDVFVYQLRVEASCARLCYTTFDGAPLGAPTIANLRHALRTATGLDCAIEHHNHLPVGRSGKYAWLALQAPGTTAL
jgi:phenylacetate-CoA ligase